MNTLWDYLHEKAPASQVAHDKRSAYYNASSSVQMSHANRPDADAFQTSTEKLNRDRNFKRSVLEKYHLADWAADTSSSASPSPMRSTDVTDSMIQRQFFTALPVLVVTFILMWLVTKALLPFSIGSPTVESPPAPLYPGLPQLPESLRVVKVPGVTYTIGFTPALVVDKESVIHEYHTTTTTPGQPYTIGNEVHFAPSTTSTSTNSTKVDTIWVRTPYQRETSWVLTNQKLKTRPSQVISAISRRLQDGSSEFVLLYNHTTGELERLSQNAHGTKGRYAMLLATLIASIGFAIWIGIILSIGPVETDPLNRLLSPLVYWLEGLIPAIIAAFIVVIRAQGKVHRRRNAYFESHYFPGIQQFLVQSTPQLERYFAA